MSFDSSKSDSSATQFTERLLVDQNQTPNSNEKKIPEPPTDLLQRLQSFLPQLARDNERLMAEGIHENQSFIEIERIESEDSEPEITMLHEDSSNESSEDDSSESAESDSESEASSIETPDTVADDDEVPLDNHDFISNQTDGQGPVVEMSLGIGVFDCAENVSSITTLPIYETSALVNEKQSAADLSMEPRHNLVFNLLHKKSESATNLISDPDA